MHCGFDCAILMTDADPFGVHRQGRLVREIVQRLRWTKRARTAYTAIRCVSTASAAQVAQLVEHATENRSVGGSIPPLGTISK